MSATPSLKKAKGEFSSQEQIYNNVIQQLIVIHNSFNEKVKHLEAKIDGLVSNIKDIMTENFFSEKKTHCCEEVLKKLKRVEKMVQNISAKSNTEERLVFYLRYCSIRFVWVTTFTHHIFNHM